MGMARLRPAHRAPLTARPPSLPAGSNNTGADIHRRTPSCHRHHRVIVFRRRVFARFEPSW